MRQIAVIGLGRFGATIARTLSDRGVEVIAIDLDKEKIEDIKDYVAVAVGVDSTDEKALKALSIDNVDAAIVCIGDNIEANLLTISVLKKLGVKNILARAMDSLQAQILKYMEVDRIINLEEEMGVMVANSMVTSHIEKHIPLASGHSLAEVKIPSQFVGKTLKELQLRNRFHINIIAIKKKVPEITESGERTYKEVINDMPRADDVLEEGDILIVVGTDESIKNFSK